MAGYIEKEPINKFITDGLNNPDKSKAFGHDAIEILTEIEYAPTVDVVEVKHGAWDVIVGMNFNKERICPICKKRIESNYWNFCSNCGAKMDGRRDA